VPQGYALAASWWRRAACQNHAPAQYDLGACYDEGIGVPQDRAEAVIWYRKAADQGEIRAQRVLGEILEGILR